ncbi:MAG: hypothetical protein A2283_03665 [Lentisphaerae bacterium RIFOXYA12_FULL_48_11]|nr:MAG: hypothetical protein A2283_03665 [Lentisphaerae bacterium RIFOXYA12_FULL_48_11]
MKARQKRELELSKAPVMRLRRFSDKTVGVTIDGEVLAVISATTEIDVDVLRTIAETLSEQIKCEENKMIEKEQKAKSKPTQDVRHLVNELKQGLEE